MDLTTAQAAAELQVGRETVVRYCAAGDLPGAYRLPSRHWRIPREAITALREPPRPLLAPRNRRSAAQQKRSAA